MAIALADSLLPNKTGVPVDARTVAANAAALAAIENPYIGMHVWINDPGKEVIVKTLKDQTVGAFTKKVIDTTEDAVVQSDLTTLQTSLSGKADASTVTALAAKVTANETSLSGKADTSTVTALAAKVTANETAIAELSASLGTAETQLNALIGEA